jgi:hypothetical protein
MRWLQSLPAALRVGIYVVAVGTVLVLAIGIGAMATLVYERGTGFLVGGSEPQQGSNQGGETTQTQETDQANTSPQATQIDTAEYLSRIGPIQNGAVEVFLESHDRILRYDTLTPADVQAMEDNYLVLRGYSEQAADLSPPEEYSEQHAQFSFAINELYRASEIAYRVTADPASATQVDFRAYDGHLDEATTSLRRSNELLGQSYSTTEGVSRVSAL